MMNKVLVSDIEKYLDGTYDWEENPDNIEYDFEMPENKRQNYNLESREGYLYVYDNQFDLKITPTFEIEENDLLIHYDHKRLMFVTGLLYYNTTVNFCPIYPKDEEDDSILEFNLYESQLVRLGERYPYFYTNKVYTCEFRTTFPEYEGFWDTLGQLNYIEIDWDLLRKYNGELIKINIDNIVDDYGNE